MIENEIREILALHLKLLTDAAVEAHRIGDYDSLAKISEQINQTVLTLAQI